MSAEDLKNEGNALFSKKQYAAASIKYTQALALDKENAVLYANRAACHLNTKEHLDAASDARKATKIDPMYSKAWARLATALDLLNEPYRSIDAWQKAVETLPKVEEDSSAAVNSQRKLYQSSLEKAHAAKDRMSRATPQVIHLSGANKHPWVAAKELIPALKEKNIIFSSAWVINDAYQDFSEGVQEMRGLKKILVRAGSPPAYAMKGNPQAISILTNGILMDHRVFHIDSNDWIKQFNDQIIFQVQSHNAWTEGGPEKIKEECQLRLNSNGWKDVRPALSTTIRGWIMRAFIEGGLREAHDVSVEFLSRALEFLDWGREKFKDVSYDDRGSIFRDTFIRAVRDMYLEAYMKAYMMCKHLGEQSSFTLEKLYEEAQSIIKEVDANPPAPGTEIFPGFFLAFHRYPKGHALSMVAFFHAQKGDIEKAKGEEAADFELIKDHYRKAGKAYLDAAEIYPIDDENHAWFLFVGLNNLFNCGTPLRITLPLIERIRLAIPEMKKIWGTSAMAQQGRDQGFAMILDQEDEIREGIASGQFTMDDCLMLQIH